jgi:hypothetical protein
MLETPVCLQISFDQYMAICDDTRIQIATLPFGGDTLQLLRYCLM